jgi:hypothetical protein
MNEIACTVNNFPFITVDGRVNMLKNEIPFRKKEVKKGT